MSRDPGFEELKAVPARFRKFSNLTDSSADYKTPEMNRSDSTCTVLNITISSQQAFTQESPIRFPILQFASDRVAAFEPITTVMTRDTPPDNRVYSDGAVHKRLRATRTLRSKSPMLSSGRKRGTRLKSPLQKIESFAASYAAGVLVRAYPSARRS